MPPDVAQPEFRFYYFTSRYPETVAFYRDVLGLKIKECWDRDGDRGTVFHAPAGVGLIEIEAGDSLPSLVGGFYIEVPDLRERYRRLQQAGAPIRKELGLTIYGHLNFKVVDPSGVELGFFQRAESNQP